MAISFVGAGTVQTGANSTVDVPSGYAAGDTLLIVTSGTATPTTPTNWVSIYAQGANRFLTVFLKIATASESSVTLVQSGTSSKAVMLAYRGTSYFDVVGTVATGTSTSPATTSQTTRFANDYVVSFYATQLNATPSTWTAPASTTSRVNSGNSASVTGMLIVDELQVSAGASATRTATLSSSTAWSAISISFKEPQVFYVDPVNGADANNGQTFATALKNISGATSAKGVQAGDTVRIEEAPLYNTGVNATWTSVQQRGISPFGTQAITGATNAAPIVVSTSLAHGYSTGDVIQLSAATGNTAANGIWKVTVTSSTQFSLDDSSGNGTYGSSGVISPIFCRTIKTASALVQPIASFAPLKTVSLGIRAAWVGATANVTISTLSTSAFPKGSADDGITTNASFTTGKIAYYTLPATLNLSSYQQLSFFIQQFSGATLGGLTISLCSDTTGDTAVDTFTIPSTSALSVWTPFTINKGSALGSSIQSISISRAANNGAQFFRFNSIVACKSPTSVDALSNTSLVTKNNGTEGAYAVGGFGGSDGTIVFLDSSPTANNLTTTGGAYYGTTETVGLWRYEPLNPYTLNSAALPASQGTTTTYNVFPANSGILNAPITYSGGWDSTNMSTRTGQTWFSNQNGFGYGLYNSGGATDITIDRVNYTRCAIGWVSDNNSTRNIIQNCNYTATSNAGLANTSTNTGGQLQSCIVTNTASSAGISINYPSNDINNPVVINNCTISGNVTNNLSINTLTNSFPYYNITNSSFNTASDRGINTTQFGYGSITSNSINYFNTRAINLGSNYVGTINNLTFVPEPAGGSEVIQGFLSSGYTSLPQNIYTTFNNVTVSAPTTTYSQGTTNLTYLLVGCSNFKFVNCSFGATNVSYGSGNLLVDQGGAYLYNCTGVSTTITTTTINVAPYILNAAFYSQDEGNTVGNNKIYFQGGLATSQTAVRNTASGYAWSLAPTSTSTVTSQFPLKLKIASVAANGGSAVTISAYMRRTNTGLTMSLVCPANQPYGPSTDTTASITAAADTWQQVSISFTPTQNGVYDIYVYVYGGTTFTGYIDDLEVTQ
jgi:hypothetical protein